MSKMQRTKGASAEREVCAILRESGAFPNAERDLEQTRGHDNGRDIVNTGEWCIQVKRRAKMTQGVILAGLDEAEGSMDEESLYAACIHRGDRERWWVTCWLSDQILICGGRVGARHHIPVQMTLEDFCGIVRTVEEVSE